MGLIVTKQQLLEYIERKKAKKVFDSILEEMYTNSKLLNENISLDKANKRIIEKYKNNKQLTTKVIKLLEDHNLIKEDKEII
jgi:hypothetical protein